MKLLLAIVASLLASTCAITTQASVGWSDCHKSFAGGHHPEAPRGAVSVCREGTLAIAYDAEMVNPAFDAYFLDHTKERKLIPGRDDFYEDPDLKSLGVAQAPVRSHAFNESWNKGHLAPSHALSWTKDTKHATYTMANVAPQAAYLNQGPWGRLETSTIDWTKTNNRSLYVITGVGYKDRSRARRSYDNVAVPDYYWKVLCDKEAKKSVGFFGHNEQGHHACSAAMKVKEIQEHYFKGVEGDVSSVEDWGKKDLFSDDDCKIDDLDKDHWSGVGGPTSSSSGDDDSEKQEEKPTVVRRLKKVSAGGIRGK